MRGKEELIPHAARAGRWLEEQSWASALPSFYLASSQSAQGVHTTTTTNSPGAYIGCVYRGGISGGISGVKGGGATGTGSQVPKAKVPLPRNAFGTPEGCGGAADVCIPSARRVLPCARSSAAQPVRQCTGRPAGKQCGSDADAAPPASGKHARHARRHRRCAFRRPFHPSARRTAAHCRQQYVPYDIAWGGRQ